LIIVSELFFHPARSLFGCALLFISWRLIIEKKRKLVKTSLLAFFLGFPLILKKQIGDDVSSN